MATLQARAGIARVNAMRVGYYTPNTVITIGGVNRTTSVVQNSLRVNKARNDEPDTATFTLQPNTIVPAAGEPVVIALGSVSNRIFAGTVAFVVYARRVGPSTGTFQAPFVHVTCRDWGSLLDRRRVTKSWTATSATNIAIEVITSYTSGFTYYNVAAGLPEVDFAVNGEAPTVLLRQLSAMVGGGYYIDADRDLHLFGTDGEIYPGTNPLSLTNSRSTLRALSHGQDASQVRTRVVVRGEGSRVIGAVPANATTIPVENAMAFDTDDVDTLKAIVGNQVIEYTDVVIGGGGSLIGPGVAPPTAPTPLPSAGSGIDSGAHYWAFTWETALGETLPSPLNGATLGPIAAPSTAPTRATAAGTGLEVGTYLYAVTFQVGAGETTPGPTGSIATSAGIAAPSSSPSASASGPPFAEHSGGRYVVGDSLWVRCSYVDVDGNETGGTDSNTVTAVAEGSGAQALLVSSLPVPSDGNVVLKRVYLNVNGSFVAYSDRGVGDTALVWSFAGTSTGSFPIGGDPARRRVSLTSIPTGPSGTTGRRIYRTVVGGSSLLLVTTLGDNTTTTYTDSTADGSLGAAAPSSNTAALNQCTVTGIAVGPAGTTQRKLYRTVAGGSQLKLVVTLANNTDTAHTDTTADGSLGANAPTGDTSGLEQATGQINTGSTTILVAGPGAFSSSGGWAVIGSQVVQYSGVSGASLTGIPASGDGSLQATVSYGSTIVEAARLVGVTGLTDGALKGADIVLQVTRNDATAQATWAVIEGGDGIHEHVITDNTLTRDAAIARADAELAAFKRELNDAEWTTVDMNADVGRNQVFALTTPTAFSDTLPITRVELTWPVQNKPPLRRVQAATTKTAQTLDVVSTEQT
jgi:hypothetical protein